MTTNLYLDTEFNGHGGELISLALAAPDGKHWYGVWPISAPMDPWVKVHVAPYVGAYYEGAVNIRAGGFFEPTELRSALKDYLLDRSGATIWADWPDDFAHLMRLMSGPSYTESFMVPCTMQLIQTPDGEPKPEHPHNALSDAIALMKWHQETLLSKTLRAYGYDPEKFRGQHP